MHALMRTIEQGEINRDRWGRPVIDGVSHTRASTLAKMLDDQGGLLKWAQGMAGLGTATSPDLIARFTTTKPEDKKALYSLGREAMDRARTSAAANTGTAIHAATELIDLGHDLGLLPTEIADDARAYRRAVEAVGLTPIIGELFVVCPELRVAGSFDRLYQGTRSALIGDLKTSGSPDAAKYAGLAWSIQCALYAHSQPFIDGKVRTWEWAGLPAPDLDTAAIVHLVQGQQITKVYRLDLRTGWQAALVAAQVRDLRATKGLAELVNG